MSTSLKITFEFTAGLVNDIGPTVDILVNNQIVKSNLVLPAYSRVDLYVDNSYDNCVIIQHKNKSDADTVLVDGQIVADKFLKVTNRWVDDILLPSRMLYGSATPVYPAGFLSAIDYIPPAVTVDHCLYFNGTLEYQIPKNFFDYLSEDIKHTELSWLDEFTSSNDLPDNDYDVKYLGYSQDTESELKIIELLKQHGYHVNR